MLDAIRITRVLRHPPRLAWRAIAERASVASWFMPTDDFEPVVGHSFLFRMKAQRGWDGQTFCQVTESEPGKRLAYTYRGRATGRKPLQFAGMDSAALAAAVKGVTFELDTVLRFTLLPGTDGTLLDLEHTGFRGIRMLPVRLIMGAGWHSRVLPRLDRELDRLARDEAGAAGA